MRPGVWMTTQPEEKERGMKPGLRQCNTIKERNSAKINEYVSRAKPERFCEAVRKQEGDATKRGGGEAGGDAEYYVSISWISGILRFFSFFTN